MNKLVLVLGATLCSTPVMALPAVVSDSAQWAHLDGSSLLTQDDKDLFQLKAFRCGIDAGLAVAIGSDHFDEAKADRLLIVCLRDKGYVAK
jgi:hypothetical protein